MSPGEAGEVPTHAAHRGGSVSRETSGEGGLKSLLGGIMERVPKRTMEPVACGVCGVRFVAFGDAPQDICTRCIWRRDRLPYEVDNMLLRANMNVVERNASADRVPEAIERAMTAHQIAAPRVAALRAGKLPRGLFGLGGGVGVGKSCALAVEVARYVRAAMHAQGSVLPERAVLWVRWPELTSELRVMAAARDGGYSSAERMLHGLSTTRLLVLDDLGAERMRGDAGEDWLASALELLLDRRDGNDMPTLYTTNLSRPALLERYGARMYSRLAGRNPLVECGGGRDMRGDHARVGGV